MEGMKELFSDFAVGNGMTKTEKKLKTTMEWMDNTRREIFLQMLEKNSVITTTPYNVEESTVFWEELKKECHSVCREIMTRRNYYSEQETNELLEILDIMIDGERVYYERLRSEWDEQCEDAWESEVMQRSWYDLLNNRVEFRLKQQATKIEKKKFEDLTTRSQHFRPFNVNDFGMNW